MEKIKQGDETFVLSLEEEDAQIMLEFAGEDMGWLDEHELLEMRKVAKGRALRLIRHAAEEKERLRVEEEQRQKAEEAAQMKQQFEKDLREVTGTEEPKPKAFQERKKNRETTVFLLDELKMLDAADGIDEDDEDDEDALAALGGGKPTPKADTKVAGASTPAGPAGAAPAPPPMPGTAAAAAAVALARKEKSEKGTTQSGGIAAAAAAAAKTRSERVGTAASSDRDESLCNWCKDEGKTQQSTVFCEDCELAFCDSCDQASHRDPKKKTHTRRAPIGSTPAPPAKKLCNWCGDTEGKEACISCEECGEVFCENCDRSCHKDPRLKKHVRERILVEEPKAIVVESDVALCEWCGETDGNPATIECPTCVELFCENCDSSCHRAPGFRTHKRVPYEQKSTKAAEPAKTQQAVAPTTTQEKPVTVTATAAAPSSPSSPSSPVSTVLCSWCGEDTGTFATVVCPECSENFCPDCDEACHSEPMFRSHQRHPVGTKVAAQVPRIGTFGG